MSALLIIAILIAIVLAYLRLGTRLAGRPYIPRAVQEHCKRYPTLAKDPVQVEGWRRDAAFESLFVTLVWPAYLTVRLLISQAAAAAPLSEHELRRQLADRDRRIAELERELGVGRRSA